MTSPAPKSSSSVSSVVLQKASPFRACLSLFTGTGSHGFARLMPAALVAVMLISTLIAPLASAQSQTIDGEGGSGVGTDGSGNSLAAAMGPTDRMKSWLYYNALSYCISEYTPGLRDNESFWSQNNRINEDNARQGLWLGSGQGPTNPDIAYFLRGAGVSLAVDAGAGAACSDGTWIRDAASLWGYQDALDLLCDTGAVRASGQDDCRGGSGPFKDLKGDSSRDVFQENIRRRVYNGATPTTTAAARYVLARNAFFVGCLGTASPSPYSGRTDDDFFFERVRVVDETGSILNVNYYGKETKSHPVSYLVDLSLDNVTETCIGLVDLMNQYAEAYQTYVNDVLESGGTLEGGSARADCDANSDDPACQGSPPSCGSFVDGIGWIVCPVLNAMANVNDFIWKVMVENLLTVNPVEPTDETGQPTAVYQLWQQLRSIANVLLIIVFLIIIFSQLTGTGVSNYGVKKLLPRLVVGAIAVNVSFYIVAILVDVFNILGSGLYDLLSGAVDTTKRVPGWENLIGLILAGGGAAAVGVLAIGAAGGIGAAFIMALPAALVVLLGFLAALFTLIVRQALLPILAVLAPVAFVAYLLPNTQQWFRKWWSMLISLLALFPLAALLFGGVQVAAITVAGNDDNWFSTLIALIMMGLPLFMLPFIARQSGPLLGKLNGALTNLAGKARNPLASSLKARGDLAKARYTSQPIRTGRRGRPIMRDKIRARRQGEITADAARQREAGLLDSGQEAAADAAFASRVVTDPRLQGAQQQMMTNKAAAGAAGAAHTRASTQGLLDTDGANISDALGDAAANPAVAQAIAASVSRATQEAIKEAELSISDHSVSQMGQALRQAMRDGNSIEARAIQNRLYGAGGIGVQEVRDAFGDVGDQTNAQTVADMRANVLQNHGSLNASAADQMRWAAGTQSMAAAGAEAATWRMADAELMKQNWRSHRIALDNNAISGAQAARIVDDERLADQIHPEVRDDFQRLRDAFHAQQAPPNPPPPTPDPNTRPDQGELDIPRE